MTKKQYQQSLFNEIKYRSLRNFDLTSPAMIELCSKYNIKIRIAKILNKSLEKNVLMFSHFRLNKICINPYFLNMFTNMKDKKFFGYYIGEEFFNYCLFHEIAHIINKKNKIIYDIHGKKFFNEFKKIYSNIDPKEFIFYRRECNFFKLLYSKFYNKLIEKKINIIDFKISRDIFEHKYRLHYKEKIIREFTFNDIYSLKNFKKIIEEVIEKLIKE